MILTCKYDHPMQDRMHGPKKRVMNPTQKGSQGQQVYRCTVCGTEHTHGKAIDKKGKRK